MKSIVVLLACFISFSAPGQSKSFPQNWAGNWKGELEWYKTGKTEPQKVNMELRIQPTDIPGKYTWQIIYGSAAEDNRPYILQKRDTIGTHWVIDENNGIVIDQFWVGNKFCGAFTVMGNTIVNSYWMENDKLVAEFYSLAGKPIASTGSGTEESPTVDSYRMNSYQKAVLQRVK